MVKISPYPGSKRISRNLEVALDKIGLTEKEIEDFKYWLRYYDDDYRYIYLRPNGEWKHAHHSPDKYEPLKEGDIEYMGEVKITPKDIEMYKLKKIGKKYNL